MIHDQATVLRQLVRQTRHRGQRRVDSPRLTLLCGGIAGVGTTTIAVHLASALASQGSQVMLVDADLDGAGATGLCGVAADKTLVDVLAERCSVADLMLELSDRLKFLPGLWGSGLLPDWPPAALSNLVDQLIALHCCDRIIIDVGVGRGAILSEFWHAADDVILVTTPRPEAIMSGYTAIKLFGSRDCTAALRLVVNRAENQQAAERIAECIVGSTARFLSLNLELLGWLPVDAELTSAQSVQTLPSLPHSGEAASDAFLWMTQQLMRNRSSAVTDRQDLPLTAVAA